MRRRSMLPTPVLLLAAAFAAGAVQSAAPGIDKSQSAQGPVHRATGTVKKVDTTRGSVTLAHEPVPSLKWPAMTMAFTVKDKAAIEKLRPGSKIDFEFVQQGRDYVITQVK
jgi:Cu(I)/Ag(I) efflux system protein CusF